MEKNVKKIFISSIKPLYNSLPVITGVVLLVGLVNALIPESFYRTIFSKNVLLDTVVGSSIGSVMAGNPVTGYVLGGELLEQGVSLVAVTAFLVAWVTVGLVQLTAESIMLGKKFAILRNVFSFLFSIIVAVLTVYIIK